MIVKHGEYDLRMQEIEQIFGAKLFDKRKAVAIEFYDPEGWSEPKHRAPVRFLLQKNSQPVKQAGPIAGPRFRSTHTRISVLDNEGNVLWTNAISEEERIDAEVT